MPLGRGTVMVGMSERTTPQSIGILARELFRACSASLVLAVQLPKIRSFMASSTPC